MAVIVMIDVECIGNPNGMVHDNESVAYGQFELGWAIAEYANGQWRRFSGTTPMPLDIDVLRLGEDSFNERQFVDAVENGDTSALPISHQATECIKWWLGQGRNISLAASLDSAFKTPYADFMYDVDLRLAPALRQADSVWASEMPLDLSMLSAMGYIQYNKKRCLRTLRETGLLPLIPVSSERRHHAETDAVWQLDQLMHNMYHRSNPSSRAMLRSVAGIGNTPSPSREFFTHKLPTE